MRMNDVDTYEPKRCYKSAWWSGNSLVLHLDRECTAMSNSAIRVQLRYFQSGMLRWCRRCCKVQNGTTVVPRAATEVEKAIEDAMGAVSEIGDDDTRFTQAESVEFYEGVANDCMMRCRTIHDEMSDG